ncbi:hypothetical protein GPZ77_34690 (plasmid) [Streptomyces sp. QHH-9511]|uniref:hypothetical protein n=1 Tax=Streptomyces sp. QHH-9511 TaxID=2684468 RepID=UPI001315BBB9|nr:hypothetical protein [Streptomyces sp. QHH-9511]QGZ53376.1 hypothetical protein GPZ77_34690 [Streptomyces sp. QHH-9511]
MTMPGTGWQQLRQDEEPHSGAAVVELDATEGLRDWVGQQITHARAAAVAGSPEERWSDAHQRILDDHPYSSDVINPGYGGVGAPFGCVRCHDWDGVTEGRGNCVTVLALAHGYGFDD